MPLIAGKDDTRGYGLRTAGLEHRPAADLRPDRPKRRSRTQDRRGMLPLLEDPDAAPVRDALCLYYQDNSLEAVTDGTYKLIFPARLPRLRDARRRRHAREMIPRRVEERGCPTCGAIGRTLQRAVAAPRNR
ncbi:MAG: hypothetical protein ACLRM8_02255 [Alistipes sp.]